MAPDEGEAIYQEGYSAFHAGKNEFNNPYTGLEAEYWSDGWEDASEDAMQSDNEH